MTFSDFYFRYPRHIGRRDAEKAWNQALKRGATPEAIMWVLDLRIKTDWRERKPQFLPYPATFLRAEDFDDEFEAAADDKEPLLFTRLPHWCPMCEHPHGWDCEDHPLCGLTYEVACQGFMARVKR